MEANLLVLKYKWCMNNQAKPLLLDQQIRAGTATGGWSEFLTVLQRLLLLHDLQVHLCVQPLESHHSFLCKPSLEFLDFSVL